MGKHVQLSYIGQLTDLQTTDKSNIVAAINEMKASSGKTKVNSYTWSAVANQTVFTIGTGSYVPNKGNLEVHIGGKVLISGTDYTETSPTSFTLLTITDLEAGDTVYAKWFENVNLVAGATVVEDVLTSSSNSNALSANQGKALNNKIGVLSNLTTTAKTDLVSSINEINTKAGNTKISEQSWTAGVGQTAFNLTVGSYIVGKSALQVFVGGILQVSGVDYIESSPTSFTLTKTDLDGEIVYAKWFEQVNLVANLNPTKVNAQSWTASANQTVFTLTSGTYLPGKANIEVHVGGNLLISGVDYTETSGNSFTLLNMPDLNGELVYAKWFENVNIVAGNVTVEDSLTSTNNTNALSANQGRLLDGRIANNTTQLDTIAKVPDMTTLTLQAAINANYGKTIKIPNGTYTISQINISGNIKIEGDDVTLVLNNNTGKIFNFTQYVDFFSCKGIKFLCQSATGAADRYAIYSTFGIGKLVINDNEFNYMSVKVDQPSNKSSVFSIERNSWKNDSSVYPLNTAFPFLFLGSTSNYLPKYYGGYFRNNRLDVYPPNSSNTDLFKLGGDCFEGVDISGNYFKNNNPNAYSQLDLYIGGEKAKVHDNTFIDVGIIYKNVIGESGLTQNPTVSHGNIYANTFVVQQNGSFDTLASYSVIAVQGSILKIVNNDFILKNTTNSITVISLENTDQTNNNGLGFANPAIFNISMNTFNNLVGHANNTIFWMRGSDNSKGLLVLGNIFMNLKNIVTSLSGGKNITASLLSSNIFTSNSATLNFDAMINSVAIGNVAENKVQDDYGLNAMSDNLSKKRNSFTISDTVTGVDVKGKNFIDLRGTVSIASVLNSFDNGFMGQEITVYKEATREGFTIVHNDSKIKLSGKTNKSITTANAYIGKFTCIFGIWYETSSTII